MALLNLEVLASRYRPSINGVIHAGAHLAEEAASYDRLGAPHVFWIEANPDVIPLIENHLEEFHDQRVIEALVLDEPPREVTFNVSNFDGMSSSVFQWGTHLRSSPETVVDHKIVLTSTTIDRLAEQHDFSGVNFLNFDLEGSEIMALRGASSVLPHVDYLYMEIRTEEVYVGAPLVDELDDFLSDFDRVETGMSLPNIPAGFEEHNGWGDAFYIRRGV